MKRDAPREIVECDRVLDLSTLDLVRIGDVVEEGDEVAVIYSPRSFEVLETLKAHRDGYVSTIRKYPVKSAGEAVMSILEILDVVKNS